MKDNEKIFDGITGIRDDLVEGAQQQELRPKRPARRRWLGAVAAVLAVALVAGYFFWPGSSPAATDAYAVSEAQYPQMAPYPDENKYISADGSFDSDGFSQVYEAWWEDQRAQRREAGYADGLEGFFTAGTRQFLSGSAGENLAYSPLNVYMALAMLAELTGGESRAQILDLLGADSIEALRQQASDVWNASYRSDGAVESILASSVWLNEDVSFNQDTMDTLADTYYASSFRGEMGSADFNKALQDWLNEQTGGLLSDQTGSIELEPETVLALATTVYFRAKWNNEFQESGTEPGIFHAAGGDVTADFMHRRDSSSYYWAENFSAASLGLENGGRMWFILPDEGTGTDALLEGGAYMELVLDPESWADQKFLMVNYSVPKFDISSQTDLISGLKALGITDVFDPDISDFSPMTDDMDGIFVSQAQHGARVAIDEEGVSAAAYTVIANAGSAAPPDEEVDFTVDRPFIFVITNQDSLPLFTGVVNQL